jgi:hypothetical protein
VRRLRFAALVGAVVVVTIGACTPGDEETATGEASSAASGGRTPAQARWTRAELPEQVLLSKERVAFDGGVLAGTDTLPHMVSGVAAEPGAPDHVRVWTSENTTRWEITDVPLRDGSHAAVAASVSDGTTTALVGHTWTAAHGVHPFLLRSEDRRTWEEVALPEQVVERAVMPQAVAMGAGGAFVIVGVDRQNRPVAVRMDDDALVVDLPPAGGDQDLDGFAGVAADGEDMVALAHVGLFDVMSRPVTYRSSDAGRTWELGDGPKAAEGSAVAGVVRVGDSFVATGWVQDDGGFDDAAAWSSDDGRRWKAEKMPAWARQGEFAQALHAPAVRGDRVVAAYYNQSPEVGIVMDRSPSGRWSVRLPEDPEYWTSIGGRTSVALLPHGEVLAARWDLNSGIVGEVSGEGRPSCLGICWRSLLDTDGPNDAGQEWHQLALDGGTPRLVGVRYETTVNGDGSWTVSPRASVFAFTGDATVGVAEWDPPESEDLSVVSIAGNDAGATVMLGTAPLNTPGPDALDDRDRRADEEDVTGWFRPSPDAEWTPAKGLAGRLTESLDHVSWLGDRWLAVGGERDSSSALTERTAVWTSVDGVAWRREDGPFAASDASTSASGSCSLPGGGTLIVGAIEDRAIFDPVAWRHSGGRWTRVDAAAFGDGTGWLSSCAQHGDVTVLQGSLDGRVVLWRTTDGATFERVRAGEHGDSLTAVRSLPSGFAAAGTLRGGRRGAVVWLSRDGERWRAVPVPSDRPLEGAEVLDWDGRLVVAATSASDPEVWILENSEELLAEATAGS